jgi:hypothetical protein
MLLGSILVACAALGYFALRFKTLPGLLALALCIFCVWHFVLEVRGVVVNANTLSFPRRPLAWLPVFSVWRRRVPLKDLDEMTVLRPWLSLEIVLLEGRFGAERLLFHSRNARLKFFDAVKTKSPGIKIYRAQ